MRTESNRNVSQNRNQFRGVNFGHIEEDLIENYPILVRGVISEIGGDSEIVAEQLIQKYPVFVRGIIDAIQAGDIEEYADEEEEWEENNRPSSYRTRSFRDSGEDRTTHRGEVTDPAHDRRLRENRDTYSDADDGRGKVTDPAHDMRLKRNRGRSSRRMPIARRRRPA